MNEWKEGRRVLTELREYAEMSHCSLDSVMSSSLPIVGSEMAATETFEIYEARGENQGGETGGVNSVGAGREHIHSESAQA